MAVCFTRQAELDLEEIGDTIAADNPSVALCFIRDIRDHCKRMAATPLAYPARPELVPEIRCYEHQRYLILFHPVALSAPVRCWLCVCCTAAAIYSRFSQIAELQELRKRLPALLPGTDPGHPGGDQAVDRGGFCRIYGVRGAGLALESHLRHAA